MAKLTNSTETPHPRADLWTLSEAWERSAEQTGLKPKLAEIESQIAAAEAKYSQPTTTEDFQREFGDAWYEKRRQYRIEKSEALSSLERQRTEVQAAIEQAFRNRMLSGEWVASGLPDDVGSEAITFQAGAWDFLDLRLVSSNRLVFAIGPEEKHRTYYLVTVWPAERYKRKRGRKSEFAFVKAWSRVRYPCGLPKDLAPIVDPLKKDFVREQAKRRLADEHEGTLATKTARKHLRYLRDFGYEAPDPKRD